AIDFSDLEMTANLKDLRRLNLGAASIIYNTELIEEMDSDLELLVADGGRFDLQLAGDGNLRIQTNGNVIGGVAGSLRRIVYEMEGAGLIGGHALVAQSAEVRIRNGGEVEVKATDSLNVTIEGTGKVCYKGTAVVTANVGNNGELLDCN
ncbi:MAG: DUF2807 domain-containing protein, partial [Bacteroidota bacterium]